RWYATSRREVAGDARSALGADVPRSARGRVRGLPAAVLRLWALRAARAAKRARPGRAQGARDRLPCRAGTRRDRRAAGLLAHPRARRLRRLGGERGRAGRAGLADLRTAGGALQERPLPPA